MIKHKLQQLGKKISDLRIAKNLKQSELAYEAGISERTLQRIEAGEVVKSDGLLKVIDYLGKLDDMLNAVQTNTLSPYEIVKQNSSKSRKHSPITSMKDAKDASNQRSRSRVRHSKKAGTHFSSVNPKEKTANIEWPEDKI